MGKLKQREEDFTSGLVALAMVNSRKPSERVKGMIDKTTNYLSGVGIPVNLARIIASGPAHEKVISADFLNPYAHAYHVLVQNDVDPISAAVMARELGNIPVNKYDNFVRAYQRAKSKSIISS